MIEYHEIYFQKDFISLHWHNRNMKMEDDGLCLHLGLDSECRSKEDWNIDCFIFKSCHKDYFYNVSF